MEDNYLISGPISGITVSQLVEKAGERMDIGANMIFLGQVRADVLDGKRVKAIEYSAYHEMVTAEVEKIKSSIWNEFSNINSIEILHSTGMVNAGETSLLVMVSAGHRQHAMQACNKIVELIKANLPVWKKEIFEDNSHVWK